MNEVPLLEMKEVSYAYADDRLALKEVSVGIYPGERVAVLGNNGAGKSTFFLCCNGVLKPSNGEVVLNGQVLSRKDRDLNKLREAIGMVFQDPDDQILASTVEAEISFGPMNLGLDREEVQKCVDEAIEAMDLAAYRNRPPHYLSGGEKKRVSIADILAMNPKAILFDEPTSSLDPKNSLRLREILSDLSESGMALLVATHDVDFAYAWAQRVLVFSDGVLLADASPREVFSNEGILNQANLQKPLMYSVVESLCRYKRVPMPENLPLTVDELNSTLTLLGV